MHLVLGGEHLAGLDGDGALHAQHTLSTRASFDFRNSNVEWGARTCPPLTELAEAMTSVVPVMFTPPIPNAMIPCDILAHDSNFKPRGCVHLVECGLTRPKGDHLRCLRRHE